MRQHSEFAHTTARPVTTPRPFLDFISEFYKTKEHYTQAETEFMNAEKVVFFQHTQLVSYRALLLEFSHFLTRKLFEEQIDYDFRYFTGDDNECTDVADWIIQLDDTHPLSRYPDNEVYDEGDEPTVPVWNS